MEEERGHVEKLNCFLLLVAHMYYNCLGFFSDSIFLDQYAPKGELFSLLVLIVYSWLLKVKPARDLSSWLLLYHGVVFFTDFMFSWINPRYVVFENIIVIYIGFKQIFKNYNLKSDKINRKNVCFLFRRSETLKDIYLGFKLDVCSFGMLIGDVFQLRRKYKTIQRVKCKDSYIEKHYIVHDTGIPIEMIKKEDIDQLLKQKARQIETFGLRLNCMRCFKDILNKLPGYEYHGELSPAKYLERIYKWKKQQ